MNDDPYFGVTISSRYHDINSLSALCVNRKNRVFMSVNIQSLMSKHEKLASEITEMDQNGIFTYVIVLQETWDVRYPELVSLNGFNDILIKKRRNMRGGGVGFYVRQGIKAEIIERLSPFEN